MSLSVADPILRAFTLQMRMTMQNCIGSNVDRLLAIIGAG
jgi:hypothetical protein